MFGVAALLYFLLHHLLIARVVAILGGLFLVLAVVAPRAYRPFHRFGQWLGRTVGALLTYVLLVPFYYLFFLPVALLLRLQKRDPMQRRPRAAGLTYWIPRRLASTPESYQRQFVREDRQARRLERPVGSGTDSSAGESSAGESSAGESSAGESSAGDSSAGEPNAGERT